MSNPQTTPERDALAAKYFPKLWAQAQASGKSKKRNQLRNAAEDMQKKEQLRTQGASCGNCDNYSPKGPCGSYCELDSDFYGYSLTKAENLCHRWTEKRNVAA